MHPVGRLFSVRPSPLGIASLAFNALLWATWCGWEFLFLPWTIAFLIVASRLGRWEAALVAITTPFLVVSAISFGFGTHRYFTGQARLVYAGLPSADFQTVTRYRNENLDRDLNIPVRTAGCLRDGTEFFEHAPHNLAVRIWSAAIGPPSNAWTRPYPTFSEAHATLRNGGVLGLDALGDMGVGADLREDLRQNAPLAGTVRVAHLDSETVVVAAVEVIGDWRILVVDLRGQRIVAGLEPSEFFPPGSDPFRPAAMPERRE